MGGGGGVPKSSEHKDECLSVSDIRQFQHAHYIYNIGDICWRIEYLCFSPGLINYFVWLSLCLVM